MRAGAVQPVAVDVTKARKVTLRLLNGGDGFTCDHAVWGLARFIELGEEDPLE
ncbi:MAG: NPCBM/NEW2 domain-containing protein [Planctomycetota bacterium]